MLSTFAEKKLYLRQLEKKINNFERFFMLLWEKLVTVSYIKNSRDYVYVDRWRHLCECLITCIRKNTSKTGA